MQWWLCECSACGWKNKQYTVKNRVSTTTLRVSRTPLKNDTPQGVDANIKGCHGNTSKVVMATPLDTPGGVEFKWCCWHPSFNSVPMDWGHTWHTYCTVKMYKIWMVHSNGLFYSCELLWITTVTQWKVYSFSYNCSIKLKLPKYLHYKKLKT